MFIDMVVFRFVRREEYRLLLGFMGELWWSYGGVMVELWWSYGGVMVELWWRAGAPWAVRRELCP